MHKSALQMPKIEGGDSANFGYTYIYAFLLVILGFLRKEGNNIYFNVNFS